MVGGIQVAQLGRTPTLLEIAKTNKMEKSYKRIRRKMEKNEVKRSKLN
jgi:hypothetical protein